MFYALNRRCSSAEMTGLIVCFTNLAQLSAATKDRPTFQTAGSVYQMSQAAFKDLADESIGNAEYRGEMVRT